MSIIKSNVCCLSDYHVEQCQARVKLNQNEFPLDMTPGLKEEVMQELRRECWNRYPSDGSFGLRAAIAEYAGIPANDIVVGNGSNEMIQTLLYATCDSGDSIVTVQPGFSMYKRIASIMNIAVKEVPLYQDFAFDLDGLIKAGKGARLMILATPNNPTGTTLSLGQIRQLAEEFRGLLVLDEAYYEFSRETALEISREMEHIIILRTFSKALGLAGLRLGYMLGKEKLIKDIRNARMPFSVGRFQQIAGEHILRNRQWWQQKVNMIIEERGRIFQELTGIEGIHPIPSRANFILFESQHMPARELFQKLYDRGVIVRWFGTPGLENTLRVTIGTAEENDIFLGELKTILMGGGNEPVTV